MKASRIKKRVFDILKTASGSPPVRVSRLLRSLLDKCYRCCSAGFVCVHNAVQEICTIDASTGQANCMPTALDREALVLTVRGRYHERI